MRRIHAAILVGLITLITVAAQDPQPGEPEVLTRGPIHEAYATSPSGVPQPGPIAPKAPPDPIEELPPEQKPEGDVIFVPGYWSWDEERTDYIWISGFWRVPPPGRQWVPGTSREAGTSWQWTAGFWAGAQAQQIEYVPPPPAPVETGASTPAPGENYLYAPGTWVYQDTRYAWRPGFWYPYRPDWIYVPAHYSWTSCGYVFVDGYWDYPLRRRGVLFAPVYFTAGVYRRPAFFYRPSYVIYDEALYGCLFVRPGFSAYYFGDYFDVRYRNGGYRGWFDVRVGVGGYDPLWGYYRHHYAGTPGWSVGINTLYAGRYSGAVARPPRTFVQQTTVVNNINKTTVINNTNINVVKNVTLAAPITNVDKTVVNLRPVSAAEQTAATNAAKDVRKASVERVKLENQVLAQAQPAGNKGKAAASTQPIKMAMPQTPVKNSAPPPSAPSPKDQPKDSPKATTPQPKDAPKTPVPEPKETPKTPPPAPKEAPKTPPPLPKETPKTPTPAPKETPKTPPPAPKDAPKTPPPAPKEAPKTPPPAPKVTPKSPPPAPKEAPKTPPPAPKGPPPAPTPAPKSPPPAPTPAPKTPPPAQKNPPPPPPKGDKKDKGPPTSATSVAPSANPAPAKTSPPPAPAPQPKASAPPPAPPKASPPPAPQPRPSAPPPAPPRAGPPPQPKPNPPAPRPAEKPQRPAEKKGGDKPKQ